MNIQDLMAGDLIIGEQDSVALLVVSVGNTIVGRTTRKCMINALADNGLAVSVFLPAAMPLENVLVVRRGKIIWSTPAPDPSKPREQ